MTMMFAYEIPGGLRTIVKHDGGGVVKFEPPLYEQRYTTTMRILEDERWAKHFKKIVEFGCSEMQLFRLLRRLESVEHLVQVDIDENVLKCNQSKVVPLISDYLRKRDRPLRVEIFKGDIADPVENLCDVDAVIGIEIIEHLYPDVLEKVPENVFGFIKPKLAIFSTPNFEYNILFNGLRPNGFRIDDHKFEWTRQEFQDWSLGICEKYKNYKVSFLGLGPPPPNHQDIGSCTQMAIFARLDILEEDLLEDLSFNSIPATLDASKQYQEIYSVDYPFDTYKPTPKEQMIVELNMYISSHGYKDENYNVENCAYQIPIAPLLEYAKSISITEEDLRDIVKDRNYTINDDGMLIIKDIESDTESQESYNSSEDRDSKPTLNETVNGEDEMW